MNFFQSVGKILSEHWTDLLRGAGTTLWVSLVGTLIGLGLGVLVGFARSVPKSKSKAGKVFQKIGNWLLNAYVEVFRGTPMMVQAMVIFWGFAFAAGGKTMDPYFSAVLIVSINTGAYITEIVRGGINSIDKGQFEGAYAVGMSYGQTMLKVITPQMFKNILPAVSNEFVVNIKDTSVLMVLMGFVDLYTVSKGIISQTYKTFETYLIICVMYFILTFSVTRILRFVERKFVGQANYKLHNTDLISPTKEVESNG